MFKSFGEGLEKNYADKIKLARFDITRTQALAKDLGVSSTPSFVMLKSGEELGRFFGDSLVKDDIEAFVDQMIQ